MATYCYTLYDPRQRTSHHVPNPVPPVSPNLCGNARKNTVKPSNKPTDSSTSVQQDEQHPDFDPFSFIDFQSLPEPSKNYQSRTVNVFSGLSLPTFVVHPQPMRYPSPLPFHPQNELTYHEKMHQQQLYQYSAEQHVSIRAKVKPLHLSRPWAPIIYTGQIPKRPRFDEGRSLRGCYTCRLRHVKCDESKPRCTGCSLVNSCCGYQL